MSTAQETDLYLPVKAFLEGQGYTVKGEVGPVDVVALRGEEPPVIVELKLGFSLALLHQGVARLAVTDHVYLCVPRPKAWKPLQANVKLCRRLGLGLMTVRATDGFVEVHADPGPYAPRKSARRKDRLLREFAKRRGDPAKGGATRAGLVTAYRQDCQRLAAYLAEHGPSKGAVVAKSTGVARATEMMRTNHYGWFDRVEKGVYALREQGGSAFPDDPITPDLGGPRRRTQADDET